jgi:hypothetical protein
MFLYDIPAIPAGAKVRPGECRFERDMCDWSNDTDKSPASWGMVNRRPARLEKMCIIFSVELVLVICIGHIYEILF